jgi:hypothetical protein
MGAHHGCSSLNVFDRSLDSANDNLVADTEWFRQQKEQC